MKKIIYILFAGLVLNAGALAQEKSAVNSNAAENQKGKKMEEKIIPAGKGKFVDSNGDGLNDNAKQKRKRNGWKADRFIDKDGDGINDNRCQGLGWGNKGKQSMCGKRGK
jgi:hypothetical protein